MLIQPLETGTQRESHHRAYVMNDALQVHADDSILDPATTCTAMTLYSFNRDTLRIAGFTNTT